MPHPCIEATGEGRNPPLIASVELGFVYGFALEVYTAINALSANRTRSP
jgi:hypothetical protein